MSAGQVSDTIDGALFCARTLKIARDEAEAKLDQRGAERLDPRDADLLRDLGTQEYAIYQRVATEEESRTAAATRALLTCVNNMSDILLDALEAAAEALSPEAVERIGQDALTRLEQVACRWASWFVQSEPGEDFLPPLGLGEVPGSAHAHDMMVATREAMRLRRRQAQLCGAIGRLKGAEVANTALSTLLGTVSSQNIGGQQPWAA
jgi:hypothetical protein